MHNNEYISFSIVIANYNSGRFLEDALLSVIKQNYPNVQLIVIDGGSTDNSLEIIKKYEEHIDYWISEKDKGQSDAFNKGFSRAKYDWLFWLNADDFLLENSLYLLSEAMTKLLKRHDFKWFCFDNIMTDENGIFHKVTYGPNYVNFFMKRIGPLIHSATSVFHRSIYEKTNKFDLNLYWAMDLDLWVQFHQLGYKYKTIHEFVYGYRINPCSKTTSDGLKTQRTPERWRQTAYLWQKNKFNVNRKWINPWRIYKIFTILIPNLYYTLKFRKKSFNWWL